MATNLAVKYYGFTWSGVGIATGAKFPDALGAAPILGRAGNPLLFTQTTVATPVVKSAMYAHRFQIKTIRYFGGLGAISQTARNGLEAAWN